MKITKMRKIVKTVAITCLSLLFLIICYTNILQRHMMNIYKDQDTMEIYLKWANWDVSEYPLFRFVSISGDVLSILSVVFLLLWFTLWVIEKTKHRRE